MERDPLGPNDQPAPQASIMCKKVLYRSSTHLGSVLIRSVYSEEDVQLATTLPLFRCEKTNGIHEVGTYPTGEQYVLGTSD